MSNEFRIRKGLSVKGSGSVLVDVQGSQGQLFSVVDSLVGSLFAVKDISGIPIIEAFSNNTVKIGKYAAEAIIVTGSNAYITGSLFGTASWAVSSSHALAISGGITNYIPVWSSNNTLSSSAIYQNPSTRNIIINSTTDAGYKLDVVGSSRFSSSRFDGNIEIFSTGTNGRTINLYQQFSSNTTWGVINLDNNSGIMYFANGNGTQNFNRFEITGSINLKTSGVVPTGPFSPLVARGVWINNTLVATANNDALIGLDINPTFTNGAFTGVNNLALRVRGNTALTGSLWVTQAITSSIFSGSFTGSLLGTASQAQTSSFVTSSNVYGPYGFNSVLSASYAVTASYATFAANGGGGGGGTSGTAGSSGQTFGTSGTSGNTGSSGSSGATGAAGTAGTSGTAGTAGTTGTSGNTGSSGSSGATGSSGSSGATGAGGTAGTSGATGATGAAGTAGTSGTSSGGGANTINNPGTGRLLYSGPTISDISASAYLNYITGSGVRQLEISGSLIVSSSYNIQGRYNPRISSSASPSAISPDINQYEGYAATALNNQLNINAAVGTPVDGQKLFFRIKAINASQPLVFDTSYADGSDLFLPSYVYINTTTYLGFFYNSAKSKWDLIAKINNL